MKVQTGLEVWLYPFFKLGAKWGVGGQIHTPAALRQRKKAGSHCIGGWVGPRDSVDGYGKSRSPPGFDPRTVQSVASRCTDCAIPGRK